MNGLINFVTGVICGVIALPMYNYSKFLYFTIFCTGTVILFIIINFPINHKKEVEQK